MYSNDVDERFFQGDILKNCKFYIPSNDRTGRKKYSGIAMILTQTCDIDDNSAVHLAPIQNISDFQKSIIESGFTQQRADSLIGQLKSKKPFYKESGLFQWFYLPAADNIEESVVLLNVIGMVNKSELKIENRLKILSYRGRHWIQYYLMRLWGRPFFWEE